MFVREFVRLLLKFLMTSFLAEPGLDMERLGDILLTPLGFATVRAEKLARFWVLAVAVAVSVILLTIFSSSFISCTIVSDAALAAPTIVCFVRLAKKFSLLDVVNSVFVSVAMVLVELGWFRCSTVAGADLFTSVVDAPRSWVLSSLDICAHHPAIGLYTHQKTFFCLYNKHLTFHLFPNQNSIARQKNNIHVMLIISNFFYRK